MKGRIETDPSGRRVYYSPEEIYSVQVPPADGSFHLDTTEHVEGKLKAVVFTKGCCYWDYYGAFAADWVHDFMALPKRRDRGFLEASRGILRNIAEGDIGTGFNELALEEIDLAGKQAVRLVARGTRTDTSALWFGTAVDFGNDTAFLYYYLPLDQVEGGVVGYESSIAWNNYQHFVQSFRHLETGP